MTGLHVAIIMDGNGRWARGRALPRWRGHLAGVQSVRNVVESAPDLGIRTLTLYSFSSDNWKRPPAEVGRLFWLLREYCRRERNELIEKGVRVTAIGRRDRIPRSALRELEVTEHATAPGSTLDLRLAIDYSSKWSMAQAVRRRAAEVARGKNLLEEITLESLDHDISGGFPHPDLLIRTGGELRLSDFLLWELADAELYFTPVLWPDFRGEHLDRALTEFRQRTADTPEALVAAPKVADALVG